MCCDILSLDCTGEWFWGFVTLEFLSYTLIEKESGFQSCEWVLGFPIGVGNDCCYVVGHDCYCVVWDG